MKKVRVVALIDHPYDAIPRKEGEAYDADEQYVETLVRIGYVKREESAEPTNEPTKKYKRRDLRAED